MGIESFKQKTIMCHLSRNFKEEVYCLSVGSTYCGPLMLAGCMPYLSCCICCQKVDFRIKGNGGLQDECLMTEARQ